MPHARSAALPFPAAPRATLFRPAHRRTLLALCAWAAAMPLAFAQQQGVAPGEIAIGTIQDLSGPVAAFGKQIRMGMLLRVDEVNEQGGIHGRKLRLLVEDSAYEPKKAVLAAEKLVNQDRIFAMVGHLGTAQNLAAMPVQFQKNVINFLPVTSATAMYEPFDRLKYSNAVSNYDQVRGALPRLVREKNARKVCTLYQDDEYGAEVVEGAQAGLKTLGMELAERTSYKRGATDFSSQVARMKAAGCDFVLLGTVIRETIGAMAEARKTGFNPVFLGTASAYTDVIPKLGGRAVDGLYATMTSQHPYLDDASPAIRFWANKYRTRFGEDPTVLSVYGYQVIDTFVQAAQKAGPRLTTDAFIQAMDTLSAPPDIFGGPGLSFGPRKRLGNDRYRLSQLQEGRWKVVSDYAAP